MRMLKSATDYLGNLKSNKQNIEKEAEFDVFGRNIRIIIYVISFQAPKTEKEWLHIASEFKEKWNFDHCIGAIDGKHILIKPPSDSQQWISK
jgi:hypothetical protein